MSEAKKFGEIKSVSGEVLVEMFGPGKSEDAISLGLRILTHQLQLRTPEEEHGGGFFGGSFGYGIDFENATFLMHQECWCDKNDGTCLWCLHGDHPDFKRLLEEKFGTEDYQKHAKRHYYDPPNFWHKATDFRMSWYKYIGRDNASNRDIAGGEWMAVMESVLASIGAPSLLEAAGVYDDAQREESARLKESMRPDNPIWKAMERVMDSQIPCWECSSRGFMGRANDGSPIGGHHSMAGDLWIARTLRDANGACVNCKTVTTEGQLELLTERQSKMYQRLLEPHA